MPASYPCLIDAGQSVACLENMHVWKDVQELKAVVIYRQIQVSVQEKLYCMCYIRICLGRRNHHVLAK